MLRLAAFWCLLAAGATYAQPRPLAGGVSADTPLRPVTRAVAFTNARVVVSPDRVLDRATVVVRDGRIESVREGTAVPFDARQIEADSLTVYAGFVDAFSTAGVAEPPKADKYTGDPGSPPRERAGIQPDRDVRTLYDPADARVAALRQAGFTVAHVAPRDGLFSGRGALVSLRAPERGETSDHLFLQGPVSLVARIEGATGVYPATPMGVLAVMREAVENTRRRAQAQGPSQSAPYNPVADALDPVIDGRLPFWMVAEGALGGFRVLRVAREMSLRPVVAGVSDARPLLDNLREARAHVVVPLSLPDTIEADTLALPAVPVQPATEGLAAIRARRTRDHHDLATERAALTETLRDAVIRAEANGAVLADARVPFSVGTFDAKPDRLLPNLRRMVRAGLRWQDALAALTTAPATEFGVDDLLGTVEPGRLAHLVVTDGPLFADSTEIRFVIVDGVVHEMDADSSAAAPARDSSAVAVGTWRYEGAVPEGVRGGTFVITRAPGGALGGTLVADGAPYALSTIVLDGAALSFQFVSLGAEGTVYVRGTLSGDTFAATAQGDGPTPVSLVATRLPD